VPEAFLALTVVEVEYHQLLWMLDGRSSAN
jgi:hypothetical protein